MFCILKTDSKLSCTAVEGEIWLLKQLYIALEGQLDVTFDAFHFHHKYERLGDLFNATISKLYLFISLAQYVQLFS